MPIGMPEERQLTIQKRDLPSDFRMPQMEMAPDHYTIGFLISGSRRIITPDQQIDIEPGDFTLMRPLLYHRTFPLSEEPYVNYLIKISAGLAEDFARDIDPNIWRAVFEQMRITLSTSDREKAEALLQDMLEVYETGAPYAEELLRGMLYRLIILMHEKNQSTDGIRFRDRLSEEIMDVMYFIEQHYSEDIRLKDAAAAAGFSEGHLSRLFTAQVGVSFSDYLINVRLRHVKELLINTDLSIAMIAMKTGFSNSDYLSASFRHREGLTPTAFRRGTGSNGI